MSIRLLSMPLKFSGAYFFKALVVFAILSSLSLPTAYAQRSFSKRFPAGKNVRVELKNISGAITVESWNRDEIKITASLETPTANVYPKLMGECVSIDVMGDRSEERRVGKECRCRWS